jgi:phosphinothricin acetyltransferase
MNVDLASRDDVAAILAISNAAAADGIANLATKAEPLFDWLAAYDRDHAHYPWLVARDGAVVGFAKASAYRPRDAYAWTAEVSVYVSVPRRGVARALYERLLPLLRAQGFATLIAGISQPNDASVALHEAFGFRRCATFTRVGFKHGAWRDVGYWELHLSDAPPTPRKLVTECW